MTEKPAKPPSEPPEKKSLLSLEKPYTDKAFWREAVKSALTQEEFVRADIIKGVSEKFAFLRATFPMAIINEPTLTFIDTSKPADYRRTQSLGDMMSPRAFKPFKALDATVQAEVSKAVALAFSKRRDAEQNLNTSEIEEYTSEMVRALEKRQKKVSINDDVVAVMDSIVGIYPYNDEYHIRISVNPIDVFMKSCGQVWGAISCENIRGIHRYGSFSDIEHYNAVAFVEDYTGKPVGRIMVRWCNPDSKNKSDVGIENTFYVAGRGKGGKIYLASIDYKSAEIVEGSGVFGFNVYRALYDHFREKGLMKYGTCRTPYSYRGWSDTMGGTGRIEYRPLEYPLKYSGKKLSRFEQIMNMDVSGRIMALRDEFRIAVDSRRLTPDEFVEIMNGMVANVPGSLENLLSNATKDLVTFTFDHFDATLNPFLLNVTSDAFKYGLKRSTKKMTYELIDAGNEGKKVSADEYPVDFLFAMLSDTKDMEWVLRNQNYVFAAKACIEWFLDYKKRTCPGRMESGVCSISLQVLMRSIGIVSIILPDNTIEGLIDSNKVSVIGALLTYLYQLLRAPVGKTLDKNMAVLLGKAITRYSELYMASETIVEEWFTRKHTVGDTCSSCGIDEGAEEPKMFHVKDKKSGKEISLTLCSQCAAKVFIVWCDDKHGYARQLRMIYLYYAKRNYAPESYCENFSKSKMRKRIPDPSGDNFLAQEAAKVFEKYKYADKFTIDYIGKRARGSPEGSIKKD